MKSFPEVRHPSLKHSVARTAQKIEGFTVTLDGISQDIKAIEKWLQDCQVRVEVEAVYYTSPLQTDRPEDLDSRGVPVVRVMRALAWAETPDAKAWRLQFREYVARGAMSLENGEFLNPPELVQSRPLIETPAAVRMQAVEGIGMLLEKIAEVVPDREPQTILEGNLHILGYQDGSAHLAFAPFGTKGGSVPVRKCQGAAALKSDLGALGLDATSTAEVLDSLERTRTATAHVVVSAKVLRHLDLLADVPPPQTRGEEVPQMPEGEMVPFDVFWRRLKTELAKAQGPNPGVHVLTVRKWSQHSGDMSGTFTVVYEGGDTFACDTASTDGWRQVSSAEVRKVYDVWRDYRAGRRGRAFIAHDLGVQNTTWIIPLLRRFEELMF